MLYGKRIVVVMLRMKASLLATLLALTLVACDTGKPVASSVGTGGSMPPAPLPTVSLAANPTSVVSGGSSTLTWSSTDATSCLASGAWSGSKALSNSQSTGPLTISSTASSSTFALTCTGSGGTTSASAMVTMTPRSYTTTFPLTENPISEGGNWINGGTDGLDGTDVSTTPGLAIGHQVGASFTDATALLTGTWGPDQMATATVHTVNQNDACFQEVELRLRSTISAHVNTGYEISFHMSQTSQAYLIIVRGNGAVGNFTVLLDTRGTQFGIKDGDIVSAS